VFCFAYTLFILSANRKTTVTCQAPLLPDTRTASAFAGGWLWERGRPRNFRSADYIKFLLSFQISACKLLARIIHKLSSPSHAPSASSGQVCVETEKNLPEFMNNPGWKIIPGSLPSKDMRARYPTG